METLEQRRERRKRNAEYYKAQGRCPRCGGKDAKTETTGGYCFECLEKNKELERKRSEEYNKRRKERKKKLYEERKESGLCTRCGKPREAGKTLCKTCAERHRAANKQSWVKAGKPTGRWNNGLCGLCVKKPVEEGYKVCADCLARIRAIKHKPPGENHPWRKITI